MIKTLMQAAAFAGLAGNAALHKDDRLRNALQAIKRGSVAAGRGGGIVTAPLTPEAAHLCMALQTLVEQAMDAGKDGTEFFSGMAYGLLVAIGLLSSPFAGVSTVGAARDDGMAVFRRWTLDREAAGAGR